MNARTVFRDVRGIDVDMAALPDYCWPRKMVGELFRFSLDTISALSRGVAKMSDEELIERVADAIRIAQGVGLVVVAVDERQEKLARAAIAEVRAYDRVMLTNTYGAQIAEVLLAILAASISDSVNT